MKTPEKNFEIELQIVARTLGCMYIKIPDPAMINKYNRGNIRESKRPFDGVLVTPAGNACIECKINKGKFYPHQRDYQERINKINKSYYVFRKMMRKGRTPFYTIDVPDFKNDPDFRTIKEMVHFIIYLIGRKSGNNRKS